MRVIKIRNDALHREFMKLLLKDPVKDVRFSGKKISLTFFGHRISDRIVVTYEDHVAEWSRRRKEIMIDKNLSRNDTMKSFKALCVHEVIEKYLVEKFGFKLDEEAHVVATQKEKEYLKSLNGNWRSHEQLVYWDWHNHGEH